MKYFLLVLFLISVVASADDFPEKNINTLSMQELSDKAGASAQSIHDIVHTMKVIEEVTHATNYCFNPESSLLVKLQPEVEKSILAFKTALSSEKFQTVIQVDAYFSGLKPLFNKSRVMLGYFLSELEKCHLHFSYIKAELGRRKKSLSETNEDTGKINAIKTFVDQSAERLEQLKSKSKSHYSFFISNYLESSRENVVRQMASTQIYGELLDGVISYEKFLTLTEDTLSIRRRIETLNQELEYALERYHLVFIQDKLPELKSLIASAENLFNDLPSTFKSELSGRLLGTVVTSAKSNLGKYEEAKTILTLEKNLKTVEHYTGRRILGLEKRIQENNLIPPVVLDRFRSLKVKLEQTTEPKERLRVYYELEIAARNIHRDYL